MFNSFLRVAIALILLFNLRAPGAFGQSTLELIIARVNGEIILKSDYEAKQRELREELAQQGLQGAQLEQTFQQRSKDILRDLIDTSLLVQQAKEIGISADLEVIKTEERMRQQHNQQNPTNQLATVEDLEKAISQQMSLDEFKQSIRTRYLSQQVLNREVYPRVIITTEDRRGFYEEHKKDFDRPEGVYIRDIYVSLDKNNPGEADLKRKKIQDALAAIKRGDEFGEIAQKFSESDNAQSGGDLGFFEKGQLSKELEDIVNKLNKGQSTDVIETTSGFMILKVEDKHAGGVRPFESVLNEIDNMLFSERASPKIREYLNKLRENGFVEVKEGYVDTGAVKASNR